LVIENLLLAIDRLFRFFSKSRPFGGFGGRNGLAQDTTKLVAFAYMTHDKFSMANFQWRPLLNVSHFGERQKNVMQPSARGHRHFFKAS
jgi:hypothetical protein